MNEQRPSEPSTHYSVITLHAQSTIDFIVRDDNHSPYAFKGFHHLDYRPAAVEPLYAIISHFIQWLALKVLAQVRCCSVSHTFCTAFSGMTPKQTRGPQCPL